MDHPGQRVLKHFMEPLGIHASQLAAALGVNRSTVSRLLAGRQPMTPALAARLGSCFGVPARWFLLMQAEYDAEQIATDTTAADGVTPIDVHDDWLLTPDGAIPLAPPNEPAAERHAVHTVTMDNGALALLSEAP